MTNSAIQKRFWSKVEKSNYCWIWQGCKNILGYGRFNLFGKIENAHRAAWKLTVGPIPKGLTLDHLCMNRACVRPEHLEPISLRENVLRGNCPAAIHARKTHCVRGHIFDGKNTSVDHKGGRHCKTCSKTRMLGYKNSKRKGGLSATTN